MQLRTEDIKIKFDKERFRPAEVPILLVDTQKIQKLGYKIEYSLSDVIGDQLNYFIKKRIAYDSLILFFDLFAYLSKLKEVLN